MVRLLATDLDGTLLLPDATVSPRVAAAIRAAEDAGIEVVVLTARSWRTVRRLHDAIPQGTVICSNGAVLYDLATDTVVRSHPIDGATLRDFVARLRAAHDVAFAWETETRAFRSPRYHELRGGDDNTPAEYLAAIEFEEEIADDHIVTKLLVGHATLSADELLAAIEPLAHGVTPTVSGGPFVEVMADGVTKAMALAALCDERGIDAAEVVAVGDHTNDLPMLHWAGRGVAMGNAQPSVLAEIHEQTASNVDDGLALVIEGLLA